jgi:hypothetical protein
MANVCYEAPAGWQTKLGITGSDRNGIFISKAVHKRYQVLPFHIGPINGLIESCRNLSGRIEQYFSGSTSAGMQVASDCLSSEP